MKKRARKARKISVVELPRTVRVSNLQLVILHEARMRGLSTLDDVGAYVQVSMGSLRYRGYVEYVKTCKHTGYCGCKKQGYVLTKLGEAVDDMFYGGTTDVHRVNTTRPLSSWLREDIE